MAVSLTHNFVSAKSDPTDVTLVKPSNWNDQHALTAGGQTILGVNGPAGAVTDNPCTSFGFSVLSLPSAASIGFTTGDVKATFKTVADTGWIMWTTTISIGTTGSGATYANTNALALYTLFWNNVTDANAPVSSGRGASAAADFAAKKTLTLPSVDQAALIGRGGFLGLALGQLFGETTHTLTSAEMPSHQHLCDFNTGLESAVHTHTDTTSRMDASSGGYALQIGGGFGFSTAVTGTESANHSHLVDSNTNLTGGGGSHNNVQPSIGVNWMLCL
jgi:microcystin-dependent protein